VANYDGFTECAVVFHSVIRQLVDLLNRVIACLENL